MYDLFNFMERWVNIHWIQTSLEIRLNNFKLKNLGKETKEQDKMIEILREHYVWLHDMENEYRVMNKVSLENNRMNLILTNENLELKKELKKLTDLINEQP